MTEPRTPDAPDDEKPVGDLFRPVFLYRRSIWRGTAVLMVLAALLGALYYLLQPVTRLAVVGFRPLFEGADKGKYPNGLPFSPNDIIDASVVDQVITRNHLEAYCPGDTLRSAIVAQEASPGLQFLDLEYQTRLSDARITAVERQRLQEEYTSRRSALPLQFQLSFIQPRDCKRVPDELVVKMLNETLETWAVDSQQKRGVLKIQVGVITPGIFDQANAADEPLLVRADLIRSGMVRVITNIVDVEKLPGAALIRVGENHVSLAEVRPRIEDLMLARLDPLIGIAGKGLGVRSAQWVEQTFQTATAQHGAAEKVAETYRQALREYSGTLGTPASQGTSRDRTQGSSDVQTLTPQIDRTFIEGIVALSAPNTIFRQEITRKMIEASNDAVQKGAVVEHYRALLESMKAPGGEMLPGDQVTAKLAKITAEAKEQTRLFNQIYDEFSRVSFRAGSALYRVERPAAIVAVKSFSVRDYTTMLIAAFLLAPIVFAAFYLSLHHGRRFVRGLR